MKIKKLPVIGILALCLVLAVFMSCGKNDGSTPDDGSFVAVTNINLLSNIAIIGEQFALTCTVVPQSATNKTIVWTVKDAGDTGTAINGGILTATAKGTVTVTATIANGTARGKAFTKDFTVTVVAEDDLQDFTLSFDLGYDTNLAPPEPITVKEGRPAGDSLPIPSPRPSAENEPEWTFAGWYEYATVYTTNTPIRKNLQLKAKWSFQNTGNPLIKHVFTADPAPLVVGDTVYLYTSHDVHFREEGYFTMYDWLCFSSNDMQTWVEHGPILHRDAFSWNRKPSNDDNADAWAAHMIERDGQFYFYVTQRTPSTMAIGVAMGSSPVGPFYDPINKPLINGNEPVDGIPANQLDCGWGKDIDPAVWIDEMTGQAYMVWGNPQRDWCLLAKLKENMIEIDGDIITIPMTNFTEGPWLYQRNGYWYNVYASHAHQGESERISYAMAPDVYGPWEHKGVVTPNAGSYTIHPGVIEFKGQSYLFYHNQALTLTINGVRWPGTTGRRAICVDYMYYNEDGTIKPVTQTLVGVTVPPAN